LKFDLDDYFGGVTLHAKNGTNWPSRGGWAKGWVKYNVQLGYFFIFLYFLSQALENTFLGVLPHFLHWMTCFDGD